MSVEVPKITPDDIRLVLQELAAKGEKIPEPQSVKVEAGEDHEGDSAYFLTVTFGEQHKLGSIRWMRISPLVHRLSRKVFLSAGGQHPVISRVRRLAEKV